jgi:endonuclease I
LTTLINQHTMSTYDDFEKKVVPDVYQRDTTISDVAWSVVTCEYSGEIKLFKGIFDFGGATTDYSREHVLCKNWMNKRGIPNNDLILHPEGSDYHNLLLTRTSLVNSERSDDPLGMVTTITKTFLQCKKGKDAAGVWVFEPKASSKGNAARAMFYQMVCYNGTLGNWALSNLNSYATSQNESMLHTWHITDGVDNFEIAKHEHTASLQLNRNPFIDHPEWADCINFKTLTALKCAASIVDGEQIEKDFFVEKSNDNLEITFENNEIANGNFQIIDMNGKVVLGRIVLLNMGSNVLNMPIGNISTGIYLLQIVGTNMKIKQRIIID